MSDWQPIETAPKDGTVLIVLGHHVTLGWFENGSWRDSWEFLDPTHWIPVPSHPDAETHGEDNER